MKKLFLFICLSINFLNLNCAVDIVKEIKCNTSKLSMQDKVNIVHGIYFYVLHKECFFDRDMLEQDKKLLYSTYKSAFEAIEDACVKEKIKSTLSVNNLEPLIDLARQVYNDIDQKLRAEKFGNANIVLCEFLKQPNVVHES